MQIGKRLADFIRLEDAGIGQANGFRTSALLASVLVGGVLLTVQDAQATCYSDPYNCDGNWQTHPHYCPQCSGHVNCVGPSHANICC